MTKSREGATDIKIVFVSSGWKGGAGYFVSQLSAAIFKQSPESILISPMFEPITREDEFRAGAHHMTPRGSDGQGWLPTKICKSIAKIIVSIWHTHKQLKERDIVVFTMMDWTLVTVIRFLLLWLGRRPFIYIVHDALPHSFRFHARFRFLEMAMLRASYVLPTRLVALTDAAKNDLISTFSIAPHRIKTMRHGAYNPMIVSDYQCNRRFLIFGMLRRNKCITQTIEAFATSQLRNFGCQLRIVGTVHEQDKSYADEIMAAADKVGDNVDISLGYLSDNDLNQEILNSEAVLLPYENFNSQSGAVILAAFLRRPIISTQFDGLKSLESLGLKFTQISEPVSGGAIVDAILSFLDTTAADREKVCAEIYTSLSAALDWQTIAADFIIGAGEVISKMKS
jgi:glycogen synthase